MPPMEFNRCFCSICLYRPSVASMVRSTVCNVYFSATYYKNNFLKHQCGSGKKRRRMDPRATIIDRLVDIFEDQGNKGMAFWILEEEPWLSSMLLVCPMSREFFGHCTLLASMHLNCLILVLPMPICGTRKPLFPCHCVCGGRSCYFVELMQLLSDSWTCHFPKDI